MFGKVGRLVLDKGYGFIRGFGVGGGDVFFHVRDLSESLVFDETLVNRNVTFEIEKTDKGNRARDIQPADGMP